jgi:putative hydrolase of the HAD superfamily
MQRLKSEYQLAVLTNGNACLTKAGASHWFDFLISAEQINASKPAPDHFLKAMERSNTPANRVIHIGDHPDNDIRAASSLGIQTVWANLEKLDWPGADQPKYQITDLAELPAVIKNLESAMTH